MTNSVAPPPTKAALRLVAKARRQTITSAERERAGRAIAAAGLQLPQLRQAGCVALYASLLDEPDTEPLRAGLRELGIRVLLPIVVADPRERRLQWAQDGAELTPSGPLALPEPTGPRFDSAELTKAEVLIVPALAVDTAGTRLGRGRAYYDVALAHARPDALVLALVYDDEVLDADVTPIPREPHDVPVQAALTPSGWRFFSSAPK